MESLKDQLESELTWLADFGFRTIAESYDPSIFGDSMVMLQSTTLRLRIIRERGHLFAELAPIDDPESWWDLHLILEALHREAPQQQDLSGVTALLRNNLAAITTALGPNLSETRREIDRLLGQRRQAGLAVRSGYDSAPELAEQNIGGATGLKSSLRRLLFPILGWLALAFLVWRILLH